MLRTPIVAGGLVALTALLISAGAAAAAPLSLTVTDLNGRSITAPGGLPAARTLLLLGFRHADHTVLDGWRRGLSLRDDDPAWLEVPVVPVGSGFVRSMILGGMKRGAATPQARAHLAPAFTEAAPVADALGVDASQPALAVVDRSGHVLARASGAYDPQKAAPLLTALAGRAAAE
jgi:hypothetical protein